MNKQYSLVIFFTLLVILLIKLFIIMKLNDIGLSIDWIGNNTARNCKFAGNDLKIIQATADQCQKQCQVLPECTHFSWSAEKGGTCQLKSGTIMKTNATYELDSSALCGIIPNKTEINEFNILYLKSEEETRISN